MEDAELDIETLLKISESLNCEYEIGIWSEANNFLQRQKHINDFTLKFNNDEEMYIASIMLREYNVNNVKEIFTSFVRFLEYDSTFYTREDAERSTQYYFVSATKNKTAFLFHITFQ